MDKSHVGHVFCAEAIQEEFKGYKVVVIDPVYDGTELSVGRVAAVLRDGEHSIYEKRTGSLLMDLRGGGGYDG